MSRAGGTRPPAAVIACGVAFIMVPPVGVATVGYIDRYFWWIAGPLFILGPALILGGVLLLHRRFTPLHLHPEAAKWLAEQNGDPEAAMGTLYPRLVKPAVREAVGVSAKS